jgi:peptidoglycan/LPS O-acetylase OafA/YrhL
MGVAVLCVAVTQGILSARIAKALSILGATTVLLCIVAVVSSPAVFGTFTASIVCGAMLTWVMLPSTGWIHRGFRGFLESTPVQFLGLISYSLYLWHFPLIAFAYLHFDFMVYDSLPGLVLAWSITVVVAVSLSWVTFRWIESPALRRKRTTRRPAS